MNSNKVFGIIFATLMILLLGVTTVFAQEQCVSVATNLAYGSRGGDVRTLQSFLANQGYPGGGSWMVTGYFGAATEAALKNFQRQRGIAASGMVDFATRDALNCAHVANTTPSYSYNPTPSVTPVYTYPYYNVNSPMLTSLSVNTGGAGTSVTVYGTGFDYSGNTVYLGSQQVGYISSNGTSITFTVPANSVTGNTSVYVTNAHGTSNTLAFNVLPYFDVCTYPYYYGYNSGNCGCGIYGVCTQSQSNVYAPTISYLNPASGAVGSSVTVYGSGFSTTGNTVHFGQGIITNLNSPDGRSVSFIVPAQISGYGATQTALGTYNVSVSNNAGYSTAALTFTVTSLAGTATPTITSVSGPTSLTAGVQGTWSVVVNNPSTSNLTTWVSWGDQGTYGATAITPQTYLVQGTNTLTFTHTYASSGTYTITFTVNNATGGQNTSTVTVNVGSAPNAAPTLSYLSPSTGIVGTHITLQGAGFTPYDNTIHFAGGGSQNVASYNNGTTLYFTVPHAMSGCDLRPAGTVCTLMAMLVTPGSYPVYVTNANGSTGTLYFIVQ